MKPVFETFLCTVLIVLGVALALDALEFDLTGQCKDCAVLTVFRPSLQHGLGKDQVIYRDPETNIWIYTEERFLP